MEIYKNIVLGCVCLKDQNYNHENIITENYIHIYFLRFKMSVVRKRCFLFSLENLPRNL